LANRNAFFLFLGGMAISLAIFLWLTVDTHRQVGALTHAEKLSDQVVAGKHLGENRASPHWSENIRRSCRRPVHPRVSSPRRNG